MHSQETPLVSVIVPTHNRPDLLEQALRSLQEQTYPNWEAVVVDNGPGLRVEHIVAQFDDPRMRYVYLVQGGEGSARNHGVSQARGAYLAFLDDDDRFLPRKLEQQVSFLLANEDVGLVGCGALLIDDQGHVTAEWPLWKYSPELTLDYCVEGCFLMPTAILMRRYWFEQVGGQGNLVRAGDTDLFLRLMLAGCEMAWIKECLCEYRVHSGSTQHDPVSYAECREAMIEGILADPRLPTSIRERSDQIRAFHALYSFAQCYVGGAYSLGDFYLERAIVLEPGLVNDNGQQLADAIVGAASRHEVSDPYRVVLPALQTLKNRALLADSVCRRALTQAAQMSFYRGHRQHQGRQVWRNFLRVAPYQPSWLLNRGTWAILVRSPLAIEHDLPTKTPSPEVSL